jgi:hypothetical protein
MELGCDKPHCAAGIGVTRKTREECNLALYQAGWRLYRGKQFCPEHSEQIAKKLRRKTDTDQIGRMLKALPVMGTLPAREGSMAERDPRKDPRPGDILRYGAVRYCEVYTEVLPHDPRLLPNDVSYVADGVEYQASVRQWRLISKKWEVIRVADLPGSHPRA